MKKNNGATFIADKPLSQNANTIRIRLKRLTDESAMEKHRLCNVRYRNKKAQERISRNRSMKNYKTDSLVKRVKFHLSKGRDVGTIAVIENKPVSRLLLIIELIEKGAA